MVLILTIGSAAAAKDIEYEEAFRACRDAASWRSVREEIGGLPEARDAVQRLRAMGLRP